MLRQHKRRNYFLIGVGIIVLILIFYFLSTLKYYFPEPEVIKSFLLRAGWFGPIILIALEVTQAVISVIPSEPFGVVAGFMYGPILGTLITTIGISLGSCAIFLLARKYGRPFVERMVHKEELAHFDVFFRKRGIWVIVITRILPIFPHDTVSLALGLTKMPFRTYAILSTISYIPGQLVLNIVGDQLTHKIMDFRIIIACAVLFLLAAIFLFRDRLKKWIIKDIKIAEREIKKEEKKIKRAIKKEEKKLKREKEEIEKI